MILRRALLVLVLPLLLAACAGLLGIKPTSLSRPFEHHAHLVKGVSCVDCHAGAREAGEEPKLHLPEMNACRRCHEKPHDERSCGMCHGSTHARERAELTKEHLRFEHRVHVQATKGQCVRCHTAATDSKAESLLPTMGLCLGCHQHEDQFRTRACDGCHVDLPAEHIVPETHIIHGPDFAREHGVRAAAARDLCASCHAERFCDSCHGATVPALPARLGFDEPHLSGLHRAGFRARHAEESRAQPGLCTTCHSEQSCRDCHDRSHVASGGTRGSPHPSGWLSTNGGEHGRAARIDPGACASCHGGSGEALCIGCHRVGGAGGNPHGPGFSSRKDKTHDVPCRSCHALGAR